MSVKDYSETEDYYSQGFEKDDVVSIWVGLLDNSEDSHDVDVLQDLCGVGYYDIANQDSNSFDFQSVPLKDLLKDMSYSSSFIEQALAKAKEKGLTNARWVTLQYDFAYDKKNVSRAVASDPVFLGVFSYEEDED